MLVEAALAVLGAGGAARAGTHGEEDGHAEGGGRFPEGPVGAVVPGLSAALVGRPGVEFDSVQAAVDDGLVQLGDNGVGFVENAPFVDRCH